MRLLNQPYFAKVAVLFVMLMGYDSGLTVSTEPSVTAAVAELENRITRDDSVTFRSWEGTWLGRTVIRRSHFPPIRLQI